MLAGGFASAILVGLGQSSGGARGAPMNYDFAIDNETVHVFIEKDGSVFINYSITFTNYGTDFDYIDIGFPNSYYVLSTVKAYWSLNGAPFVQLTNIARSSVIQIGVEIYVPVGQRPGYGGHGTLIVWGSNPHMVYWDTVHVNYAGIEFSPTWFSPSYCRTVSALNLHVHFPEGFNNGTLAYYHHNAFTRSYWTNTSLVYVWEWRNEYPQQHTEGVSFPAGYVDVIYDPGTTTTTTTTTTWTWPTTTTTTTWTWTTTFDPWSRFSGMLITGGFVAVLFVIFTLVAVALVIARGASGETGSVLRQRYLPPAVQVEALGLCRGLSVVEAAVLHEVLLDRVFTMIVFGLLRKGVVTVRRPGQGKPTFQANPEAIATTASTGTLHYYERLFLKAILPDGSLDKEAVRAMLKTLINTTARKLEGFSRTETKAYYQQMVAIAWKEMAAATTPTDQMRALDDYAEWLLLDPEFEQRLTPYVVWYSPLWYHHFHTAAAPLPHPGIARPTTLQPPPIVTGTGTTTGPGPTTPPITTTGPTTPPITTTGPTGGPPPVTIVDFANTFVIATQTFANNVVTGFQQLANQIALLFRPPPPPSAFHAGPSHTGTSHGSSSHGGGGHACACACACVSCACACAGGGR